MDKIIIRNARFNCIIGILDHEKVKPQEIIIDLELFIEPVNSRLNDYIKNTIDYAEVHELIESEVNDSNFGLIETLAETIAAKVLGKFKISKILVRIKKPAALAHKNVEYAAVEIIRTKNKNHGDKNGN